MAENTAEFEAQDVHLETSTEEEIVAKNADKTAFEATEAYSAV